MPPYLPTNLFGRNTGFMLFECGDDLRLRESSFFHVQSKFKILTLILNCLLFRGTYILFVNTHQVILEGHFLVHFHL